MAAAYAALGLRVHSGWAAGVVVAGPPASPQVIDRRRLVLADEAELEGAKQPYHAAEGHPLAEAKRMIDRFEASAHARAREGLREALVAAAAGGHRVTRCGLLLASGRPLPGLEAILASHTLIHTADGQHFRNTLVSAAAHFGLRVTAVREREVEAGAAEAAGIPLDELRRSLAAIGKGLGPPWTADQKLATLAAWLALATA